MPADRRDELRAVGQEIREVFRDAGVRGWLHAAPLRADGADGRDDGIGVGADDAVVMASVYKLVVLLAWCRAVDDGTVDPRAPVHCAPRGRTTGPTGLSVLSDDVTLSGRDLVALMITLSDNAAADHVLDLLGPAALDATLAAAGLSRTRIVGGTGQAHRTLIDDTSAPDIAAAFRALADDDAPPAVRALDPAYGSATTPREMTRLLDILHHDRLTTAESGRWARTLMSNQVWPHRLRAGFPEPVTVAGKTGTLGPLRNEVGLVCYPGEQPVAVAVFTHAARSAHRAPRADAAIAAAARLAVGALRSGPV